MKNLRYLRLLNKTALEYEYDLTDQINMRLEPFGPHCPEKEKEEIAAAEEAEFLFKHPRSNECEIYYLNEECAETLEPYLKIQEQSPLSKLHIKFMLKQKKQLPKELEEFLERNKEIYCY
ncbi:hypothetical protein [Mastigocoleus testarum]|nr:hypothetical protein [Mastigocoleus testarum]